MTMEADSHQTNMKSSHSNEKYILRDERKYRELYDMDKEFAAYSDNVYSYLCKLPPGRELRFDKYDERHKMWIIWTCCVFMHTPPNMFMYRFTDDYSAFRHDHLSNEEIETYIERFRSNRHK